MKMAVFTKGLTEEQRNEMINYARENYEFSGEYYDEEKLLRDAAKRTVEKHGNSFYVIEEGSFSLVLSYSMNSLSDDTRNELKELGIKIISLSKQKKINEIKENDEEGIEVVVENKGKYAKIEPL